VLDKLLARAVTPQVLIEGKTLKTPKQRIIVYFQALTLGAFNTVFNRFQLASPYRGELLANHAPGPYTRSLFS